MSYSLEQLGLLVRARYALLYLLTHEEQRVERRVQEIGLREGLVVWRWRVTSGLVGPDGEPVPETTAPARALVHILSVPEPALFLLNDFHPWLDDPLVIRHLRDLEPVLAARAQSLLVVAPLLVLPREIEKDCTVIDVGLPGPEEIGGLLDEAAERHDLAPTHEARELIVRASAGLTATEIRRMLHRIRLAGGRLTPADLPLVVEEKSRAIRRSRHLEFWDLNDDMGSVGGLDSLKAWLDQRASAFSEEARAFGLPAPRGLFLLGVQGCGKSLMAKCVAGAWKVPLLRLDVGAVFQVQEQAESSLRDTVRIAEGLAPVVLWIDELEKGFMATRDDGGGRALGAFLTWMQEKTLPVFVVGTANDVRLLPPELLRKGRFDEIFFVDLPNVHERLAILEIHLRRRRRDPEAFDLTTIAEESERFSGAELEQVVVSALFKAWAERRELRHEDLLDATRETVPLAITMDDRLKELREWARPRARRASEDTRRVDFFSDWGE
ncbi:MAG: AAA family ATPase [Pseudomonadota bacterium]